MPRGSCRGSVPRVHRASSGLLVALAGCSAFGAVEPAPASDGGARPDVASDAGSPVGGARFCDGAAGAAACWDFEGGEPVGQLFTEIVPPPSAARIEPEGPGSTNRVLRVDATERFVRHEFERPAAGGAPYELRFRFRVDASSHNYCVLGGFAYGYEGNGGDVGAVATYSQASRLGPNKASGQDLIEVQPGVWHQAVVVLSGSPPEATVTVDARTFDPIGVDDRGPRFELRLGAYYCNESGSALSIAFDDIVVRRL